MVRRTTTIDKLRLGPGLHHSVTAQSAGRRSDAAKCGSRGRLVDHGTELRDSHRPSAHLDQRHPDRTRNCSSSRTIDDFGRCNCSPGAGRRVGTVSSCAGIMLFRLRGSEANVRASRSRTTTAPNQRRATATRNSISEKTTIFMNSVASRNITVQRAITRQVAVVRGRPTIRLASAKESYTPARPREHAKHQPAVVHASTRFTRCRPQC